MPTRPCRQPGGAPHQRPRMDPQGQAGTYLKLRGKLPCRDKGSDLQPQKKLQALIVVIPAAFPMVHYGEIMISTAGGEDKKLIMRGRFGSALLCHSFFLRLDLSARFLI